MNPSHQSNVTKTDFKIIAVYNFYWKSQLRTPTLQEVSNSVGIAKTTVFDRIKKLKSKGWLNMLSYTRFKDMGGTSW